MHIMEQLFFLRGKRELFLQHADADLKTIFGKEFEYLDEKIADLFFSFKKVHKTRRREEEEVPRLKSKGFGFGIEKLLLFGGPDKGGRNWLDWIAI